MWEGAVSALGQEPAGAKPVLPDNGLIRALRNRGAGAEKAEAKRKQPRSPHQAALVEEDLRKKL